MAMIFVKCAKCGNIAPHTGDWTGTMDVTIAGRTYHLCEECASPVLTYILEGGSLPTKEETDGEGDGKVSDDR